MFLHPQKLLLCKLIFFFKTVLNSVIAVKPAFKYDILNKVCFYKVQIKFKTL